MKILILFLTLALVGCEAKEKGVSQEETIVDGVITEEDIITDEEYIMSLDMSTFGTQEEIERFLNSLEPDLRTFAISYHFGSAWGDYGTVITPSEDSSTVEIPTKLTFNPNTIYTVGVDIQAGKYLFTSDDHNSAYIYNVSSTCEDCESINSGRPVDLEEGMELKFTVNASLQSMENEFLRFDETFKTDDKVGFMFMDSSNKTYTVGVDIAEGKYKVRELLKYKDYGHHELVYLNKEDSIGIPIRVSADESLIYLTNGEKFEITSGVVLQYISE